ncbi:MAG TPA: hypothetical protein VN436_12245, partial [Holophaga sp.]|nr:hypothetical protein [Holophaga sp.]
MEGAGKLRWRCAEGHEWEAHPLYVRRGSWCPACAGVKPLTLDDLRATARLRGGECLSEACLGSHEKHLWRCSEGHTWEATPASIRKGRWCPACAGVKRLTLEDLQRMARARGGECLSGECMGSQQRHRWRCAEGHVWLARPNNVRHGSWCPECSAATRDPIRCSPLTLQDLQRFARERQGECLSATWLGSRQKHRWRCAAGHEWEASPHAVRRGSWCPVCAGRKPPENTVQDLETPMRRQPRRSGII